MGQHKTNPNCKLAKEGLLPAKHNKLSKKQTEEMLYKNIITSMIKREPKLSSLVMSSIKPYY